MTGFMLRNLLFFKIVCVSLFFFFFCMLRIYIYILLRIHLPHLYVEIVVRG
jgi:hypothetical protein